MFQVNHLLGRRFTSNTKSIFIRKIKVKNYNVVCGNFCLALQVKVSVSLQVIHDKKDNYNTEIDLKIFTTLLLMLVVYIF